MATKTKLPPNPLVSEILAEVSKQRSKAKKVEVLQQYGSLALKSILIWNFDDSVVSMLPEGEVPYKPNESPKGTEHNVLDREYKHLYNFVKGGNDALSKTRREHMFLQIIEGLHAEEAEVICLVKDKQLSKKFKITKEVVKDAFPDIDWGGRS